MNKYHLLADFVTLISVSLGVTSIILLSFFDFDPAIWTVRVFTLIACLDFLDGPISRKGGKRHARFDLDTFSDFVVFGVAGGVVAYFVLDDFHFLIALTITLIFMSIVFYRLQRFSTKKYKHEGYFSGMPAPVGVNLVVLTIPFSFNQWIVAAIVLASGLMMISTIPFFSFKVKYKWPIQVVLYTIATSLVIQVFAPNSIYLYTSGFMLFLGLLYGITPIIAPPSLFPKLLAHPLPESSDINGDPEGSSGEENTQLNPSVYE